MTPDEVKLDIIRARHASVTIQWPAHEDRGWLLNYIAGLQLKCADLKADYLRRHKDAVDRYEQIERLQAQLPEGMKDCTIQFIQCPKGHGRLTATNWVQRGCDVCRLEGLLRIAYSSGYGDGSRAPHQANREDEVVAQLRLSTPEADTSEFGKMRDLVRRVMPFMVNAAESQHGSIAEWVRDARHALQGA